MQKESLIKSTNELSNDDMVMLREKFISEYSTKMGWDKNKLDTNQLMEIVKQKGYLSPGIILG